MRNRWAITAICFMMCGAGIGARQGIAAVPNSFMLHEANTVSTDLYLEQNKFDTTLGRIQGNGQNWIEFLAVQGDEAGGGTFRNTLDLRGWSINWKYDKNDPLDPNKSGEGTIKFTEDDLWKAVPRGTMLTINEWKKVWYRPVAVGDPGYDSAGKARIGGINGFGETTGLPTQAGDTVWDFQTNTQWNPNLNGGGAAGDWNIHVWAGERNPDNSYKYFTFTGSVINGDPQNPIAIDTPAGGLYAVNNDNWQWTIKDKNGAVVQGPFGETKTGLMATSPITGNPTAPDWDVNSQEILRLENVKFKADHSPTQATYLGAWLNDYQDGSSGSYAQRNVWSSGTEQEDLSPLRNWLVAGDVDLSGKVDGNDFLVWQRNLGTTNASLTQGDLDGDGTVTALDLGILKSRWGASAVGAATGVPECGTSALAAIAAILPWVWERGARRKRKHC